MAGPARRRTPAPDQGPTPPSVLDPDAVDALTLADLDLLQGVVDDEPLDGRDPGGELGDAFPDDPERG